MSRLPGWMIALCASSILAQVPLGGPNVNMVSGTTWPGGDPFLQRQNEPSLTVSSRNPQHLLGGANDYRTVDLAIAINAADPDAQVTGDGWLGLFKSFDGGQTWTSTVLPGCPYPVLQCQGSVLSGNYQAGSDPVVRAGSNGMFYYSAIAFNRDRQKGAVFVARLIDDNDRERSVDDPVRYLGDSIVSTGTSTVFLDKPWLAVDVPRFGAAMCSIPASGSVPVQNFAAGHVYVAYAAFTGNTNQSAIYFSRSTDCAQTWSAPKKISGTTYSAQGATVAVEPLTGAVYVACRSFLAPNNTDSIWVAKSTDGGQTFGAPAKVADIIPFDLGTSTAGFRTLSFPAMAVDGLGIAYVAWAGRQTVGGDARIMLSTSWGGRSLGRAEDGGISRSAVRQQPGAASADQPGARASAHARD